MYAYVHERLCLYMCAGKLVYLPAYSCIPILSCAGAAQESWLSGGQSSEKNTLEKNILKKKEGIENKKFLLKQSIVLEECLKLLDQSGAARDSSRVSTTHVGASRLTMQLAVVYRELGRPDQAKSLLNSLLLRLRMKQEHAQDERRYVRTLRHCISSSFLPPVFLIPLSFSIK